MRKLILTMLTAIGILLFAACGSSPWEPQDLSPQGVINSLSCDDATQALDLASRAVSEQDPEAMSVLGLTEDNKDRIVTRLESRKTKACEASSSTAEFTADQEVALRDCVKEEERKNYKPSSTDLDSKLLTACKATGKQLFDSLDPKVRGDAKVGHTPAHFAADLAATTDLKEATFGVRFLKGVKDAVGQGQVVSDSKSLAIQLDAAFGDAKQGEVRVGTKGPNPVNFAANKNSPGGRASFTDAGDEQFKSTQEIANYLTSGTPKAQAASSSIAQAIRKAGYGDDEVARATDGTGYIPIQFKDASQVLGTSYFKDDKVLVLGKWRQAKPGDVYWLFVTKDGKLILGATLRGKCYNPGITQVVVVRPGMPPAPPVEQPPGEEKCPPGTVMGPTGRCEPPTTTTPPPPPPPTTPPPPNDDKRPNEAPGQGGRGDGGDSQYGGPGTDRQQTDGPARPPDAGDPPAQQPTAEQPAPNPVPGGQPAPQEPVQPPATGAPDPEEAPSECVNPPGMNVCG